jgi:hypothetical protein
MERAPSLRKKALLQRRQAKLEDAGIHGLFDMTDVAPPPEPANRFPDPVPADAAPAAIPPTPLTRRSCRRGGLHRGCRIPAGSQADRGSPAGSLMPVGLRVAALPLSDRSRCCLRPSHACRSWPGAYRAADHLAGMAPTAISAKINIAADLVGDTGIEPVTSSV